MTIKSLIALAFAMLSISANAQNDSIRVRMDFNENPWGMATCPYRTNDNGRKSWSYPSYEPEAARLTKTTVFEVSACGDKVSVTVTPSDLDETDYDNALVRDENYNNNDVVETYLYAYTGSKITLKAPKGYYMAKVAFDTYRTWASGGLYSGEVTNSQHVWGPDTVKVRTSMASGVETTIDCWSGDSIEWSLPAVTSCTRLRYIDFWFLPLKGDASAISVVTEEKAKSTVVTRADGMAVRRDERDGDNLMNLPKGVYIVDGKKIIVK